MRVRCSSPEMTTSNEALDVLSRHRAPDPETDNTDAQLILAIRSAGTPMRPVTIARPRQAEASVLEDDRTHHCPEPLSMSY